MTTTSIDVSTLLSWGERKRLQTSRGPRYVQSAMPTDEFWDLWRARSPELKAAGISVTSYNGQWKVNLWTEVDTTAERQQIEASQASDGEVDGFDVPCPEGLAYLPFQKNGIAYALGRTRTLIGDEMGLGKGIQAIGFINSREDVRKILVICPASIRLNWQRELEKWLVRPFTIGIVDGGSAEDWLFGHSEITITNYDVIGKHRARIDKAGPWDLLILDEVHYLKNSKAQRTKQVYGCKPRKGGGEPKPAIEARYTLALSGTPSVNRPVELWPWIEYADPLDLGRNFFAFAKRFCSGHKTRWGWDFTGASNLDELQRMMRAKFMVRRLKKDVLAELPPKQRQVLAIPPTTDMMPYIQAEHEAEDAYEDRLRDLQAAVELSKASEDPEVYEAAVRALRECLGVAFSEMSKCRHDVALAKVPVVVEHLKACLEEGPVVCFAWHLDVVAAIQAEFPGSVVLTGQTQMVERQEAVDAFQAGRSDLFIGNIKAAGVGLTLVRSSHVVFAELDWTPGNITQAEDRCHRIGQKDSVLVQHIVLDGSIDSRMAKVLVDKQDVLDRMLDNPVDMPPPAPTKLQPATANVSRDKITRDSENITVEISTAVHEALQRLAGRCDGAQLKDGCGFNKIDSPIGKSLAACPVLTNRQAALGRRLVIKYKRQLPHSILDRIG